jgi:UDP-N-acetylmuramoyl-tripeptide--D-alanyl-D-alanine ligase
VVAVTGSNGKTTVKRMIHHVLAGRLVGSCSPKSYNNQIGVPLTLLGVRPADDYVVCEVGSNAPGEVAALGRLCRPALAVITSVGPTHLERLLSVEGVAVEKASLLGELAGEGIGVVCGPGGAGEGAAALNKAIRAHGRPVIRFGEGEGCQVRLTAYEPRPGGARFEVNGHFRVDLAVPGRHNALNALAAMTVAQRFGIDLEEAGEALADFEPAEMRLQPVAAGSVTILNDAYNANPASMSAAAEVLAEHSARRRVFVAGDMLELGADSPRLHRQTGRRIAQGGVDLLIAVGAMGRYVAEGAAEGGSRAEAFASVEEAAGAVPGLLRPGDVVLLKGSRGMAMERLVAPIRSAFEPREPAEAPRKGRAR